MGAQSNQFEQISGSWINCAALGTESVVVPGSPCPRPENFGYECMDGFGECGSGGWCIEGGEEAFDAALSVWEKANAHRSVVPGLSGN